jgi:hypothetical protein
VPVTAWPAARRPAHYLGVSDLDGAVAQRWATDVGTVALLWSLPDQRTPGLDQLARQVGSGGHRAVVSVTPRFGQGPELEAVLPGIPGRRYAPRWAQLAQVLGTPVPYWPSTLRERDLIHQWQPDAGTVTAMAVPVLDTGTLLRTAAGYPEGHPSGRVLVNLSRMAHRQAQQSAESDLNIVAKMTPQGDVLIVAARPLDVPLVDQDDVDPVQRRAGWLDLLARTDVSAARCVRAVSMWDGGADLPYSNPDRITPQESRWAREWAGRLQPAPRTAAAEILSREPGSVMLVDPETDAPVVREPSGELVAAIPQRLPAHAPLAELILDGPIWVRTADGMLYPAPRDACYGINWGYAGSGPGTLALVVSALLDDITAKAPGDINDGPPGLEALFSRSLPDGTVLTRRQLEAARRGAPPVGGVDPHDDEDDEDEDGDA